MPEGASERDPSWAESRKRLVTLVAEHHRELYQYAYRLTGSSWDAEDLTQQTFLAAHRKLHQLRNPERSRAWLFTVLRRCYFKIHARRTPAPESSLEVTIDLLPAEPEADQFDVAEIDREQLQSAVNELPVGFKVVVFMFYFEDCSYREIARRLKLPIGTVMSRLARAKHHMRARLTPAVLATSGKLGTS